MKRYCVEVFLCNKLNCHSRVCDGVSCHGQILCFHNVSGIAEVIRLLKASFNGHFTGDAVITCFDADDDSFVEEVYVKFPGGKILGRRW